MIDQPTRILIVDDEPAHVTAIRRALLGAITTMEVTVAASLQEFAQATARFLPDLVLLDWVLPDGCAEGTLKSPPENGAFPIVVMTSHGDERTAVTTLQLGAMDYVVKTPKAFAEMPLTVHRVLRAWRSLKEQQSAQEALRHSEERYRGLVETTFEWIWEVDAQGRYIYTSPKVQDLLGYTPEEVLGLTPFQLMPEAEAQRVGVFFKDIIARRASFSALENVNRHKNGQLVVLETSAVPVLGPQGELQGYRGMDRDITQRKQLEAQLRQAQKLEAVGQLAGGVAHDFNNILAAIMMQLALLEADPNLDPETRQVLKDLQTEARRAINLTRQLLMFSRRSVLVVKPLDLDEVIENLLRMLRRLIGEHIELQFARTTSLPMVEADAGMMEQVLLNLAVNARDAMPKGGRITISTTVADLEAPAIGLESNRRPGRFVCFAVVDTGCGMEAETLKRAFEPFFTTKEPGKGTGLGLATVHGIVAQHKGWVEVESEVGVGTTFRVYVPAAAHTAVAAATAAPPETIPGGSETILLVEDEVRVRQLAARTLRVLGYRVYEAGNGPEAMARWQQHGSQIDLLLTDMIMPEGMTGLELIERLQAIKPSLPTILASGYATEIVQTGGAMKPNIRYLPKPYDNQVLADVVRACLDQRPSAASAAAGSPLAGSTPPSDNDAAALTLPLMKEKLALIPPELRKQIGQAAVCGRYHRLLQLIDQLAALDKPLGQRIRELAAKFDYVTLTQLFDTQ